MGVNGAVIAVEIVAPYLFEKLFTGKSNALVADKVEKQMRSDPTFAEMVKQITTNINTNPTAYNK